MDTAELIMQCRSIQLNEEDERQVAFKCGTKTKGKNIEWLPGGESSSLKRSKDRKIEGSNTASMENKSGS